MTPTELAAAPRTRSAPVGEAWRSARSRRVRNARPTYWARSTTDHDVARFDASPPKKSAAP
jgi:hypothetical protein